MANEIKLVTYANSEVTPQNDAVLTNLEIASNGVIFGCNVTIKNASTLHINAGMGVVYGREFEIVDSDIPVSLSSSGTLLGQLYVHIDLANTSEPAQLLVDTGNSLTPLVDDPTINITTGSTDYQLATFTVDTSTLANLTETFSIVNNPSALIGNTDISGIADGTLTGAVSQLNTDLSGNSVTFTPSIQNTFYCMNATKIGKVCTVNLYIGNNYAIPVDGTIGTLDGVVADGQQKGIGVLCEANTGTSLAIRTIYINDNSNELKMGLAQQPYQFAGVYTITFKCK